MATTAKNTKKSDTNSDEVKDLKAQVAQLTETIQILMKASLANANQVNNSIDRDVTFVSLCHNILNLSTEPYGGGIIYTFTEFGEEQVIPYSDARLIIRNNKKFVKEGKCYIADSDIVEAEHLTKDYEKLLNKEDLVGLLNKDRQVFARIFDSMTNVQKELFKDILAKQLKENKNGVDMNIVQKVNETLNIDILKDLEFSNSLFSKEN